MKPFPNKNISIILLIIFTIFLSLTFYLFFTDASRVANIGNIFSGMSNSQEYAVELGEDGFYPKELTIHKGDTIKFTTTRNKLFWPASNLHPSHTIYPEFDPREPIEPSEVWSFRFNKTGKWRYHDHLSPIYGGEINVLEKSAVGVSMGAQDKCKNLTEGQAGCRQDLIEKTLKDKGIGVALDIVGEFYANEASFTSDDCHSYVHTIGEEAYVLYANENLLDLSPKTSLCDYGFFHGFMERLVQATGNLEKAREFCNYVEEQLASYGGSCFHGIGHGVADSHDPRFARDPRARITPALNLCKDLSDIQSEVESCLGGVFNELSSVFVQGEDGISIDRNEPLAFCRTFSDRTRLHICYQEFAKAILGHITDIDFAKSIQFIEEENITDDESAKQVVRSMASTFVLDIPRFNVADGFRTCETIEERLRAACTAGLTDGLRLYGDTSK